MSEGPASAVVYELERARQALGAAELLHKGGYYADAVSRAYYAVFHAASALLASIGRLVRTHDGLRSAIGEHFVRPGRLPPRFGRLLARTAADRNDADYNTSSTFTAEDAQSTISDAREFVAMVEAIVASPPPGPSS